MANPQFDGLYVSDPSPWGYMKSGRKVGTVVGYLVLTDEGDYLLCREPSVEDVKWPFDPMTQCVSSRLEQSSVSFPDVKRRVKERLLGQRTGRNPYR